MASDDCPTPSQPHWRMGFWQPDLKQLTVQRCSCTNFMPTTSCGRVLASGLLGTFVPLPWGKLLLGVLGPVPASASQSGPGLGKGLGYWCENTCSQYHPLPGLNCSVSISSPPHSLPSPLHPILPYPCLPLTHCIGVPTQVGVIWPLTHGASHSLLASLNVTLPHALISILWPISEPTLNHLLWSLFYLSLPIRLPQPFLSHFSLDELTTLSPSKSSLCLLDPVLSRFLVTICPALVPFLCYITNLSLSSGSCPNIFQYADVSPALNKSFPPLQIPFSASLFPFASSGNHGPRERFLLPALHRASYLTAAYSVDME